MGIQKRPGTEIEITGTEGRNRLLVSLEQDNQTFFQKVCLRYEKSGRISGSVSCSRSEIKKKGSRKLRSIMEDWGIPEGQATRIIGQVLVYMNSCREEDMVTDGDGMDEIIKDLFTDLLLAYGRDRGEENRFMNDRECLYVEKGSFDRLAADSNGDRYKNGNILHELNSLGFLKTNPRRNTFQKHVGGIQRRYVALYWDGIRGKLSGGTGIEGIEGMPGGALKKQLAEIIEKGCGKAAAPEKEGRKIA